jgi:hypothetical protein
MNEDIGQHWSPPQELMLPTPRPVRRVGWLGAVGLSGNKPALVGALVSVFAFSGLCLVFSSDKTLGFMGLAVTVGFAILLSAAGRMAKRLLTLLTWGKPARAVVFYVQSNSVSTRYSTEYWVSLLKYQDDMGHDVIAKKSWKYEKDQVLTVLYDPNKPTECVVYPVDGYEIGEPGSS